MSITSEVASTCPEPEELEMWARDERDGADLARHVDSCAGCRAALAEINANDGFLARVAPILGAPSAPAHDGLIGSELVPGFEIVEELHRGGQGIVYRAYDIETRRFVAIKTLLQGTFATPRQRRRFEREIEIIAGLHHPNIVTLFQTSELSGDRLAYVMEYIDGEPLDRWATERFTSAASSDASTIRLKLEVFARICDAIQYAHEHGVVHRDLKPGNILIDRNGEPQIVDFGLARTLGGRDAATVTAAGEIVGTFAYAAPEQLSGEHDAVDTRTDVYAMGVLLYELLTGVLPFRADGPLSELIAGITSGHPLPPSTHQHAIDDDLETIVLKAMSKEPERRYSYAGALSADIRHYLANEPIDAKRDSTLYVIRKFIRRHRLAVAIATAFVVLITAFAVFMAIQAQHLARQRDAANEALRDSRFEYGRSLALGQGSPVGEEALWEMHLTGLVSQVRGQRQPGPSDTYWALWDWYARNPCLGTVDAGGSVAVLAIDPSSRFVAAAAKDGPIGIWRVSSNELVVEIPGSSGGTRALQFAPDGQSLLAIGADGTADLWDWGIVTRLTSRHLAGFVDEPRAVTLSADGHRLAAGGADGFVQVWDLTTGAMIGQWQVHETTVRTLALDADGGRLATSSGGDRDVVKVCRVWNVDTQASLGELPSRSLVNCFAFAPDGSLAFGRAQTVMLWDFQTKLEPRLLQAHGGSVNAICFSPDGRTIISTGRDMTVKLWDTAANALRTTLSGHHPGSGRIPIAIGDDGTVLATADIDGAIKLWDMTSQPAYTRLLNHSTSVHAAVFSPVNDTLLVTSSRDELLIWNLAAPQSPTIRRDLPDVSSLAFSPDGAQLATGSKDGSVRIWSAETWEVLSTMPRQEGAVNTIDFSPDGRHVVAPGDDGTIGVWEVASGRLVQMLQGHIDRVPTARFCPADPSIVASASMDGTIRIWDWAAGTSEVIEAHAPGVRVLRFSPDGRMIASGGSDQRVKLWDTRTRECIAILAEHSNEVFALDFSQDGLLASGSRGGLVKVWDLATAKCLVTLADPGDMVFAVAFSKDGRTLVSGSADTSVGIWDLSYFDRHIAGNLDYQAQRVEKLIGRPFVAPTMRRWASEQLGAN